MPKLDRQGKCPNCGTQWKGEDVLEALSRMACNSGKSLTELKNLAANYGWTEVNKNRFSLAIVRELEDGRVLLQCPAMRCNHVFEEETGTEYSSIRLARAKVTVVGTKGELEDTEGLDKLFKEMDEIQQELGKDIETRF